MTNSWQDPLAQILGGQGGAQTGAQHIMPVGQPQQGGGFGGLRDQALQRLRPGMGGFGMTPGASQGQAVAPPSGGAQWGNAAGDFQNQVAQANQAWQAQVAAFQAQIQQQMQQMQQQQAQQQAMQQPMVNPAGPPPINNGMGEPAYAVGVNPNHYGMDSQAMQMALINAR